MTGILQRIQHLSDQEQLHINVWNIEREILHKIQHLSNQELLHIYVWNIDQNITENKTSIRPKPITYKRLSY